MGGFLPRTDAGLLLWGNGFSSQISTGFASFGLTNTQATDYASTLSAYSDALNAATNESTRTKGTIAGKNSARAALRFASQQLAALVQAHPGITPEQLEDLGLTVRDQEKNPVPPVSQSPMISVVSVSGRIVRYKLKDRLFPDSRRKPANAEGAVVLTYVGTTPPPSSDPGWKLQGQTGRTTVVVQYPDSVTPGTACWVTAMWFNRRGEYSPACDPLQTYLQIGPVAQAA